jgi:LPXTG-motif cell wall-anchored protein
MKTQVFAKVKSPMKSIRNIVAALAAVLAIAGLAQATPVFADNAGNPNDAAYWEAQLGDGATCVKHNPKDVTSDGKITDGGKSVTLNPGNWALLVVNSGAAGPDNNGNLVYHNPAAGTAYFGPLNNGGQQGNVSHWIVCGTTTPQPDAQVTYGQWVDGKWICGDTTVVQTRTVTTTPYALVNGQWQLDAANATVTTEHQTRQLTAGELATCIPPQPEAKVTHTDWVDGTWVCGDVTVDQTRTTTITSYVLVDGQWVLDTENASTSTDHQTRPLTAAELATCTPDQPQAEVTYGEWVDGAWECGDTTVLETRTVTTTPYALVDGQWVLDTENATTSTAEQTRPLTTDELATCIPDQPQPEAQVTPGQWVDGTWGCGDTTVLQTRTVTTTPYALVDGEWQLDAAHATVTTEQQTRELAAGEQTTCDVVVPTQAPSFVEPTCTTDAATVLPQTQGVTYTADTAAAPGATVTVTAAAQPGYVLSGEVHWTHTFATLDQSDCVQSEAIPPTTEAPTTTVTPTTTDPEQESEAATTTVAPATQLPKTGSDHATLIALIAAVVLGGGAALSAMAARRRN